MIKISINKIPGSYARRVFIGGDYSHYPLIKEMRSIVARIGFTPVVANDYEMEEEEIHDSTMRLLHSCKYAIFDISTISGALMEIERIRDYNTKALIVFSSKEEEEIPKQQTTRMIDPTLHQRGYKDFTELRIIIENFLARDEFLINYLILCGTMEIATGKKPDTQAEYFKNMLMDMNSGIRESLVCNIFNAYGITAPKVEPRDFVKKIYSVIFKRSPSETEIKRNTFLLIKRYRTPAQLFIDIIYSDENLQRIATAYKFGEFQRRKLLLHRLSEKKNKR